MQMHKIWGILAFVLTYTAWQYSNNIDEYRLVFRNNSADQLTFKWEEGTAPLTPDGFATLEVMEKGPLIIPPHGIVTLPLPINKKILGFYLTKEGFSDDTRNDAIVKYIQNPYYIPGTTIEKTCGNNISACAQLRTTLQRYKEDLERAVLKDSDQKDNLMANKTALAYINIIPTLGNIEVGRDQIYQIKSFGGSYYLIRTYRPEDDETIAHP